MIPLFVRNAAALPSGARAECVTRMPTWRMRQRDGGSEEEEEEEVVGGVVGSVKEPPHSAPVVLAGNVLQKMCFLSGKRIVAESLSEPGP